MTNNLTPKIAQVKCPECGNCSEFSAWTVIPNVFLPEVAESLRDGSLFKYECKACGYKDIVPYQCLYHDVPHAKLVLMEPRRSQKAAAEAELERMTRKKEAGDNVPRHIGRLVFHPARLSEKARIFEAGLDDCAIEIMKLKMKEQLIGDDPLFETMDLYFEEADGDFLIFYGSGAENGSLTALRALYDQAVIDCMAHPPTVDDFVVDERWAQSYMSKVVLSEAEGLQG